MAAQNVHDGSEGISLMADVLAELADRTDLDLELPPPASPLEESRTLNISPTHASAADVLRLLHGDDAGDIRGMVEQTDRNSNAVGQTRVKESTKKSSTAQATTTAAAAATTKTEGQKNEAGGGIGAVEGETVPTPPTARAKRIQNKRTTTSSITAGSVAGANAVAAANAAVAKSIDDSKCVDVAYGDNVITMEVRGLKERNANGEYL